MAARKSEEQIVKILRELSDIYSPTGFTARALEYIAKTAKNAGLKCCYTNKGALIVGNHAKPEIAVAGHVDTLGLMVKEIRSDGNLGFTKLGGPVLQAFEGKTVRIFSEKGKIFSGSLILNNPAAHVNNKASEDSRTEQSMHIRLDAEVKSAADTEKLGIQIGDFIAFDAGFEFTDSGFVKSHFLDDKAGCAAMIDAFLNLGSKALEKIPVMFFFSNYEEVGHGACAGIADSVKELLVVDMGVVGHGVSGSEQAVSICAKDSSGPYDYDLRLRLTQLARKNKLPFKLDVFPFYGSDGSAALRAGHDLRVGLIGPGVSASHGNERTHMKGLKATRDLVVAYLKSV
ncbi:MAG: M42 family metallopeptidase [Candidatus Riflebacteria bacterium]|nr:M42 family metallopeptidase [Candidatus Riflebacteria bacterium]